MDVVIFIQSMGLDGRLEIPEEAGGLVIITSSNSESVSGGLQKMGLATLSVDLAGDRKEEKIEEAGWMEVLTERLIAVTKWCQDNEKTSKLPVAYLGIEGTAAATLSAAAYWGTKIKGVVALGGRPDLAMEVLDLIESPTMVIVVAADEASAGGAKQAFQKIGAIKKLETQPSNEDKLVELMGNWFLKYL